MKHLFNFLVLFLFMAGSVAGQGNGWFASPASINNDYLNSCATQTHNISLKVYLSNSNDNVTLNNVNWTSACNSSSFGLMILPSSGTKYSNYVEFDIVVDDNFVNGSCLLQATWTYHVNGGSSFTNANVIIGQVIVNALWTPPTFVPNNINNCGSDDIIDVAIDYENDADSYSIAIVSGGTPVGGSGPISYSVTGPNCTPTLNFQIEPDACDDLVLDITRTRSGSASKTDRVIVPKYTPTNGEITASNPDLEFSANGDANICIELGAEDITLYAPYNEFFFGTSAPSPQAVNDLLNECSNISATWSLNSAHKTTGARFEEIPTAGSPDFAFVNLDVFEPGVYQVDYTLQSCGQSQTISLFIYACDQAPALVSGNPPIGLQYICSLGGPNDYCDYVNLAYGCKNTVTVDNSQSPKILWTYDEFSTTLCLSSIFVRERTTPITVTNENVCGTSSATWDIIVDDPDFCGGGGFRLQVDQNSSEFIIHLEPINSNLESKERIEEVFIYDMGGRLVWNKQGNFDDRRLVLAKSALQQAGIYAVTVVTNKQTYSQQFVRPE